MSSVSFTGYFSETPPDAIETAINFLSPGDLESLGLVSKAFQRATQESAVWEGLATGLQLPHIDNPKQALMYYYIGQNAVFAKGVTTIAPVMQYLPGVNEFVITMLKQRENAFLQRSVIEKLIVENEQGIAQDFLFMSLPYREYPLAQQLLGAGISFQAEDRDSAMEEAIRNGYVDIVESLIKKGTAIPQEGVLTALRFNQSNVAYLLLARGGACDERCVKLAIEARDLELIKALLEQGIRPTYQMVEWAENMDIPFADEAVDDDLADEAVDDEEHAIPEGIEQEVREENERPSSAEIERQIRERNGRPTPAAIAAWLRARIEELEELEE